MSLLMFLGLGLLNGMCGGSAEEENYTGNSEYDEYTEYSEDCDNYSYMDNNMNCGSANYEEVGCEDYSDMDYGDSEYDDFDSDCDVYFY